MKSYLLKCVRNWTRDVFAQMKHMFQDLLFLKHVKNVSSEHFGHTVNYRTVFYERFFP